MANPEHRLPDRPGGDDPGRGRRVGVDVGSVRIGVAVSDPDGILATPVETVRRDKTDRHLRRLTQLIGELEAVEVVVGLPRTLADRTGPSAQDAIELAEDLGRRVAPTPTCSGSTTPSTGTESRKQRWIPDAPLSRGGQQTYMIAPCN